MPASVIMPSDEHRFLRIDSPLGADLLCTHLSGEDRLGRPFEYQLDLISLDHNIPFEKMVGEKVCVKMELPEQGQDVFRYFHGYVTEFCYTGFSGRYAQYQATLKPWLWFLSRTSDCRIFQNMTVPDIINKVFGEYEMSDVSVELAENYNDRKRNYCVQYRETDLDFVSRLMEQEGIFYYFQHEESKHVLVLADGLSAHDNFPGYETVPYFPLDQEQGRRERDYLHTWVLSHTIMPQKVTLTDFDFEKSRVRLEAQHQIVRDHADYFKSNEIYDYPGVYNVQAQGDNFAKIRMEEYQAQFARARAQGNAKGMCAGYYFALEDFPRDSENKDHLIVAVSHDIQCDAAESETEVGSGDHYECSMEVIDFKTVYRSACSTPKPFVHGPQTAVVVGKAGQEIHCDKHGRVKVQFHWDREGGQDENSSCWVRVSQAWAGSNWGSIHIPRIGQEVVVSFLEGDPDRPLITGRVYNDQNMPPYTLPDNQTQSGIKSRSSEKGGQSNFNEIRFEDKKGEEELYVQAEKDRNILVKNDDTLKVEGEKIGRKIDISKGHHELTVDKGNQKITIKSGNQETKVSSGKITVEAAQSIEFKCGGSTIKMEPAKISIKSTQIEINGQVKVDVKAMTIDVAGSAMTSIKGGLVKIN